ncbi:MAG: mechanosensitive ion channel family protein [Bacteroidales bacterium]|nr:mechanosensitive ion channel family protein [Bacteroidales bacterium]
MLGKLLQLEGIIPANADSTITALKEAQEAFVANFKEDPNTALQGLGEDALQLVLKVVAALIIYIIGAWLIKKIRTLMQKGMTKRNTDHAIISFTTSLVSIALTVLLIVVVIGTLGINTTSLAAVLAAGGMAIGLALSGTMQNFAGGLMLIAFKPFKAGDLIEAQGFLGTVTEVNIVSTKLRTPDNRVIILPNGALSSGTINNYSPKSYRRLDIDLPFQHGTDVEKLMATLKSLIAKEPRVVTEPDEEANVPFFTVCDIDKDAVTVRTRVWCKNSDYWPLYFGLRTYLYTALTDAGFKFAATRVEVKQS